MFVIDDILLAPAKSFFWLAREIQKAAEQAQADDRESMMRRLQSLHMKLEAGDITEAEFEEQESEILDALDAMDGAEDDTDEDPDPDPDPEPDPEPDQDHNPDGHQHAGESKGRPDAGTDHREEDER